MKTAWQGHSEQDLVEVNAKGKALHNAGQGHLVQFLVEVSTKGQALQTAWQGRSVHALVWFFADCYPPQSAPAGRAAAEEDQLAEGSLVQRLPVLGRAEAGSTCFVY